MGLRRGPGLGTFLCAYSLTLAQGQLDSPHHPTSSWAPWDQLLGLGLEVQKRYLLPLPRLNPGLKAASQEKMYPKLNLPTPPTSRRSLRNKGHLQPHLPVFVPGCPGLVSWQFPILSIAQPAWCLGAERGGRLSKQRTPRQEAWVGPRLTGMGSRPGGHQWVSVNPSLDDGVDRGSQRGGGEAETGCVTSHRPQSPLPILISGHYPFRGGQDTSLAQSAVGRLTSKPPGQGQESKPGALGTPGEMESGMVTALCLENQKGTGILSLKKRGFP